MAQKLENIIPGKKLGDAKKVYELRKKLGWSQRKLAEELGVTSAAVARWESGERNISGPVKKLMELLEKS